MSSLTTLLVVISFLSISSHLYVSEAQYPPPLAKGLSWNFYCSTCPNLESIIRNQLRRVFQEDIVQAGGLLRLHNHDCFVQGCDSSVLLKGSVGRPGEQVEIPNLTLRLKTFDVVEDLRRRVHRECGRIVSCSDILTIAARDAVALSGGPDFSVPLGRRDGIRFADVNSTLTFLPPPFGNTSLLLSLFQIQGLDATDLVALSGAHTIGRSHCSSFSSRLFPTQDPTMENTFANNLKRICPTPNTNTTTVMDIKTPVKFDNMYYVNLRDRQTLFTSDQDLFTDLRTRGIVNSFAFNERRFFRKFASAMIKMGQIGVLTGAEGEIRANCNVRNSDNPFLSSVVGGDEGQTLVDALRWNRFSKRS